VKKNYQTDGAAVAISAGIAMPQSVTVAMAELTGALKEGLLALAVGAGLQVMQVVMEESVTELAGQKGRHDPNRSAVRHGSEDGSVTLGGRRVPVRRPRVRAADGSGELAVAAYELFASTELLGQLALERMMAKLSTRRYPAGLEPVGSAVEAVATSTSKSSVSRRFVERTEVALAEMLSADLTGLDLMALMVDGVHFAEACCVVALGISADGTKVPLGVVEGATENASVVTDLLVGLRERGLDVTRPTLVVIDGSKALAALVAKKMRAAYRDPDPLAAQAALEQLARDLAKAHPGAAASLREGLVETLTVGRLGVPPTLARTLRSTNAIESMIEICRDHATNVKRWRDGQMALRWCAAGMGEAAKQFRRVNGHLHLPALRRALEAHFDKPATITNSEMAAA